MYWQDLHQVSGQPVERKLLLPKVNESLRIDSYLPGLGDGRTLGAGVEFGVSPT